MATTRFIPTWTARGPARPLCGVAALLWLFAAGAHAAEPHECVIEPNQLVDVGSSEVGVLGAVRVDEADIVQAGDVIAALRTDVERAALDLSRTRAGAGAEIALLRRDYEFNLRKRSRIDKLNDQQAVSAQSVDEVRTAEELALLRLRAAAEERRLLRLQAIRDELALGRRTVRSPINGVVVQRYKAVGEYVEGDPIVQLAQLDPLRVDLVAPISMYGQIAVGMQATVHPELPLDGHFVATVTRINPLMDAATATFSVRLSLPNPEHRLPPGLTCTLVLHPQHEPSTEASMKPVPAASTGLTGTPPVAIEAAARTMLEADVEPAAPASISQPPDVVPSTPAPSATATTTTPDLHPRAGGCATLGPLGTDAQADAVAARLATADMRFERRYTGAIELDPPWIVLSRDPHPAPAKVIARLERAGVKDFQRLTHGEWQNRLSYGTYRGRRYAKARQQALEALGFAAELRRRVDGESNVWLDLAHPPGDPALSSVVTTVRGDHPALTLQSIPCPQLASR